jgi:hypothetical protein
MGTIRITNSEIGSVTNNITNEDMEITNSDIVKIKNNKNITKLLADDFDCIDFGILRRGTFDDRGLPCFWHLAPHCSDKLPSFCKDKPVMSLSTDFNNPEVYLRGLYSDSLTRERTDAIIDNQSELIAEWEQAQAEWIKFG